ATEPRGELLHERLRRADAGAYFRAGLSCRDRQRAGEDRNVRREARATRGVIAGEDERLQLLASLFTRLLIDGAHDGRDLGRDDVPIGMHRDQESAPLECETDAAT